MDNFNIEIIPFSIGGLHEAAPLLAASSYPPLRYLAKELGKNLTDFWSASILELLQDPTSRGFLAVQADKLMGMLISSGNPWETNMLGRKTATIHVFLVDNSIPNRNQVARSILNFALQAASKDGIQFMVGKTYANDPTTIHALESGGFLLMDTVMDCYYDYRRLPLEKIPHPTLENGITLRIAASSDRDELALVAGMAFQEHFGRFHADERIGRQVATQIYEQWMRSSLDGYADWIHLAMSGEKIIGFSIWKLPSIAEKQLKVRVGHYSIAGIHPDYHGKGLFTALTYAGMQSLQGLVDIIEGPTHVNNYGVQRGYSTLGWRVCSDARHTFHKWME
jgi:hypothetical protein